MLQLCLNKAKDLAIEKVLVTCDEENIASAAVIEKAGGVLEDISGEIGARKKRYWITLNKTV